MIVTVGIWLGQARQGFRYADGGAVRREIEKSRGFFRRYRRHPALLMWGLGNEMEGSGDDPEIWRTVNEIARVADPEDPNHPTMTVMAEPGPQEGGVDVALSGGQRARDQLVRGTGDAAEEAREGEVGPPMWSPSSARRAPGKSGRRPGTHRSSRGALTRPGSTATIARVHRRPAPALPGLLRVLLGPQTGGDLTWRRDVSALG